MLRDRGSCSRKCCEQAALRLRSSSRGLIQRDQKANAAAVASGSVLSPCFALQV